MLFFVFVFTLSIASPIVEEDCLACILQRQGNLAYILRRAIHQSGPDENLTFGHCFVCLRCADDPIDYCRGWWPSEPDGGDYEGDDGKLVADRDEKWDKAACSRISKSQSIELREYLSEYEKKNKYQVLNKNARSCLGFCEDVAIQLQWSYRLRSGNLTIPGRMTFPETSWQERNSYQEYPSGFLERMWQFHFQNSR